jgi:DNA-binding transcriptional MerR regulator
MQTLTRPAKSHYTEGEVAEQLGVSLEHLRSLIRERVMPNDDDVRQTSMLSFQPSDLLLLRLLVAQSGTPRD